MQLWLTPQQQELGDDLRTFARQELEYDLINRDSSGTFLESNWKKVAEKGVLGLNVPEEYGGSGYDLLTTNHALYSFGYGCPDNGLNLTVASQIWALQSSIIFGGSEEQKQRYLPPMLAGDLYASFAMTEAEAGSDAYSLKATAVRTDGGYILNGAKSLITFAPLADIVVCFASTNPDVGSWGISAFIVHTDAEGVTRSPHRHKMGTRTGPFGDLTLEDVFVPEEDRLGNEGAGASIFQQTMIYERGFLFSTQLGSMARQLDESIAYAQSREQGGKPIGKYQSISNRIADMRLRLETAMLLLYKTAWAVENNQDSMLYACLTKLHLSEMFLSNSLDSVRIHGGVGYLSEYEVERNLRDAVGGVIYSGTSDIQRNIIARILGL